MLKCIIKDNNTDEILFQSIVERKQFIMNGYQPKRFYINLLDPFNKDLIMNPNNLKNKDSMTLYIYYGKEEIYNIKFNSDQLEFYYNFDNSVYNTTAGEISMFILRYV